MAVGDSSRSSACVICGRSSSFVPRSLEFCLELERYEPNKAKTVALCGHSSVRIAKALQVCVDCVRSEPEKAKEIALQAHVEARIQYGLPERVPRSPDGKLCGICGNACKIGEGERGFCGLKTVKDGKLVDIYTRGANEGLLQSYLDPHPTNCCSTWFCPAGTGVGYPDYCFSPERGDRGYFNYAVFMFGCNFNCLYCQNPSHKRLEGTPPVTVEEFSETVRQNKKISCICYFGGDPTPQLPFTLKASKLSLEKCPERKLKICYETNGAGNSSLEKRAAELCFVSGGNIKFDLKCFDPNLSHVLSGVDNSQSYENFRMAYEEFYEERKDIPVLTGVTLLVPGYVDAVEVENIAKFIADLNPDIPYSLLVFHPQLFFLDMGITPLEQVKKCYQTAKKYLNRVKVGNLHLLPIKSQKELE